MWLWLPAVALGLVVACAGDDVRGDAGPSADAAPDAPSSDAGPGDAAADGGTADAGSPRDLHLLVFSRTVGFRHDSIAGGVSALQTLATERGWTIEATEDPLRFEPAVLESVDVVVFLCTTGDVLESEQEQAFEAWFRAGGGFVGIHSASDTEYDWLFYGVVVGAYFDRHPAIQTARIEVVDRAHPSTVHLDAEWTRRDEWYDFRDDPSDRVDVLLRIDASSYEGSAMGDHPVAWSHEPMGGRAFYTALGHTTESYQEPAFIAHLAGGIAWAAGPP